MPKGVEDSGPAKWPGGPSKAKPVTVSEVLKWDSGVKRSKRKGLVTIDISTKYMPPEKWPGTTYLHDIAPEDILWKQDRPGGGWRACVPKALKPGTGRPPRIPKAGKIVCNDVTSNGDPCRQYVVPGTVKCTKHGGGLPNYRKFAMERLERNAPRAVKTIVEIMNEGEDDKVRLAASKDILDRTGVNAPKEVRIEMSAFEKVVEAGGVLVDLAGDE